MFFEVLLLNPRGENHSNASSGKRLGCKISWVMNLFQETWDRASPAMMFIRPSRKAFGDYGRLKTTSTLREMHHYPHAGNP